MTHVEPRHPTEPQRAHQSFQADVWEAEAEILLDRIGVEPGWTCVDLGSGAVGILPNLARRVGDDGVVVGVVRDPTLAHAAREMMRGAGHSNVHLVQSDLLDPGLAPAAFDLVHVRFTLHVPAPERAAARMTSLAKPGGWVALQEPDLASWRYRPECAAWPPLLAVLAAAIGLVGDPNVGRRVPQLLEGAGLEAVQIRSAALTLSDRHPHMRLPLAWAATQRATILEHHLAEAVELDDWIARLEAHLEDPGVEMITPTTVQGWGRRADCAPGKKD